QRLLSRDAFVNSRIEPDVRGTRDVLLPPIPIADDEEIAGVSDEVPHPLEALSPRPDALRPDDDFHAPVLADHQGALTLFDGVAEHVVTPEVWGALFAGKNWAECARHRLRQTQFEFAVILNALHPLLELDHRLAERPADFGQLPPEETAAGLGFHRRSVT